MSGRRLILRQAHPTSRTHRGIRLKKRVTRLFRCIFRRRQIEKVKVNAVMKAFRSWAGSNLIRRFGFKFGSGYTLLHKAIRVDTPGDNAVPKGHLAVYVGPKEEEAAVAAERVVVPVIYINHPLFGRLLREAEEKYGFDHPGGITIPCHVSEFESIKTRIAAHARGRGKIK